MGNGQINPEDKIYIDKVTDAILKYAEKADNRCSLSGKVRNFLNWLKRKK